MLAALPSGFSFPEEVEDAVSFDETTQTLRATRLLSFEEGEALLGASQDQDYRDAASALLTLQDATRNTAKHAYVQALGDATGWTQRDLEVLIGTEDAGLLETTFPEDFLDERILVRLRGCQALLARTGMSPELCGTLSSPAWCDALVDSGPCREAARGVRQVVRARYDEERWLEVAQPLRDVLREEQRAALVDYLLAHPGDGHMWRDTNDVYAYFLIDVEMSPCQMTSRIKQAISSVQLFVQRCLMNLEPDVKADAAVDDEVARVEVDEELPRLGSQPQGLPLPGELDRAGAARRQVALLQGARERAAAGRHDRGHGRDGLHGLPREAGRGRAPGDLRDVRPDRRWG